MQSLRYTLISLLVSMQLGTVAFASTSEQRLALSYNQQDAYYSLNLTVGEKIKQTFSVVLDTGSSNLNLIGDKSLCPDCQPYSPSKRLQLSTDLVSQEEHFDMGYVMGTGGADVYRAKIALSPTVSLEHYDFGVYRTGKNINNIAGFGLIGEAEPLGAPLLPLFYALDKHHDFGGQFTLKLRGFRGPSYLILGSQPLNGRHRYSFGQRRDYIVQHTGVYDAHKRPVALMPDDINFAALDSGTGGRMVYPPQQCQALQRYIKQHVSAKYRSMPESWWLSNSCAPAGYIDPKSFPTLTLGLIDDEGHQQWITLPPESYLTRSGCDGDERRFTFACMPREIRDQNTAKQRWPVILGTPFLEQLTVTFDVRNRQIML